MALHGEERLHFAGRAKITGRDLVGIDNEPGHPYVRSTIAAGGHERPVHAVLRRARAVGSAVVIDPSVPRPQRAIFFHPGAQPDDRRMARLSVLQLLLVALDELDRPARCAGEIIGHDDVFRSLFATERTASGYRMNHDHLFGNIRVFGKPTPDAERRLVTLPNPYAPLRVDLHQSRARFDEALVYRVSRESAFENLVRFRETPFHVSLGSLHLRPCVA